MQKNKPLYDCTVDYSIEAAADFYRGESEYNMRSCECECTPKPVPNLGCDEKVTVVGNSVNFSVGNNDSEIKADIIVGYRNSVRVWGQVKDCNGQPIGCAYVKLVKMTHHGLVGIAHTISDCLGFYQFDICPCTDGCDFTVIVGKAATGSERVVTSGFRGLNCNPANGTSPCDDSCGPCERPCK